ncbi:MAG: leader peptidase (prepilin peptidase) / N-methyltransferase [Solirubrobacteraceae bacterium]|nr:leader peptidase (prepilin peptidase) / N-methyltransferase [Solirubrobacteraceae bacterium]
MAPALALLRAPARHPLAAALTAVLAAAVVAVRRDDGAELVLGLVLVGFLVPISLADLDRMIIPNRLTLPAALLAVALGTALDPGGEAGRLLAGAVAGAVLAIPSLLRPAGIGMGDAKLLAVLGLFLGEGVAAAFVVAFCAGAVAGIVIMVRRGVAEGRRTPIPFGPFLALGGVVGVLAGDAIMRLYVSAF